MFRRSSSKYAYAWRITYVVNGEQADISGFTSTWGLAQDAVARHAKLIGPAKRASSALLLNTEIVDAFLSSIIS